MLNTSHEIEAWTAALSQAERRADPLADAAACALQAAPEGRVTLARALQGDRAALASAPPPLRALLEPARALPPWVDRALLERGSPGARRSGVIGAMALLCVCLPVTYLSPTGNKPLVLAGGLTGSALPRMVRTARFVRDVSAPGALLPGGAGWAALTRVRLGHAMQRQALLDDPRWAWGVPIHQGDMALTTALFGVLFADLVEASGLRLSAEEREAHRHLWQVAGALLGVDAALLPEDDAQGRALIAAGRGLAGAPDEDTARLMRAWSQALSELPSPMRQLLPTPWLSAYSRWGLSRAVPYLREPDEGGARQAWAPRLASLLYGGALGALACAPGGGRLGDQLGQRTHSSLLGLLEGGLSPRCAPLRRGAPGSRPSPACPAARPAPRPSA